MQRASAHARVFDHAESTGARDIAPFDIAFRVDEHVGTRIEILFAAQWLAYAFPCRRFAWSSRMSAHGSGADVDRYSFIAADFHHHLSAGLTGAPSTYPVSGSDPGQDGDPRVPCLIKGPASCLRLILTPGQARGSTQAEALIDGFATEHVIADKAYDTDKIRAYLMFRTDAVIPWLSRRREQPPYDDIFTKSATSSNASSTRSSTFAAWQHATTKLQPRSLRSLPSRHSWPGCAECPQNLVRPGV